MERSKVIILLILLPGLIVFLSIAGTIAYLRLNKSSSHGTTTTEVRP